MLKSKDEAFAAFKKFHVFVIIQTGRKLKCLGTDKRGEFTIAEFNRFCENLGIKRELTIPYCPQLIKETALKTAVHVCNRSPHMSLKGGILEEVCFSKPTSYDHLHKMRQVCLKMIVPVSVTVKE